MACVLCSFYERHIVQYYCFNERSIKQLNFFVREYAKPLKVQTLQRSDMIGIALAAEYTSLALQTGLQVSDSNTQHK